jgi:hypothetical protein
VKVNLKNLILAIDKKGLGIGQFLSDCKVAPSTYTLIRKGNNKIKLNTVSKMAKFLQVDIETLIEEY